MTVDALIGNEHYLTISDLRRTLIGYENYHNALCLAMKTIRRLGPHEWELNRVEDGHTYTNDSISGYSYLRQVTTKIIIINIFQVLFMEINFFG